MLTTSHPYAGQNRVSLSAVFSSITAIRCADDHAWAQLAFSQVIGGIQAVDIQETQQMRAMFTQPAGKTAIIPVFQIIDCAILKT